MNTFRTGGLVAGKVRFFLRAALGVVAICPVARAAIVVGISEDYSSYGTLVDVDPTTGMASNPRLTGVPDPNGVAFSPTGTLYSITEELGGNSLYTIDLATGASKLVGATGLTAIATGDLAFAPNGTLYGMGNADAVTSTIQLFTVNTATGAATIVGSLHVGPDVVPAMAFTPAGKLYIIDSTLGESDLLTVNPATGATTHQVTLSQPVGYHGGMYFDPGSGDLIMGDGWAQSGHDLYSIDPATGDVSVIGSLGTTIPVIAREGLDGLAATNVPLPMASCAGIPCLIFSMFLARRFRHRINAASCVE